MEKQEKEIKKPKENKKSKRKVSIFTVFLWLFLIITMSVITIGMFNQKNAIEVTDNNWNIQLFMYDRSGNTPNQAITEFTWEPQKNNDSTQLAMQISYACTTGKAYQPGEIVIEIPGFSRNSRSEYYRSNTGGYMYEIYDRWLEDYVVIAADKKEDQDKKFDWSYSYNKEKNLYTFTNNIAIAENEHFEGTIQIVYTLYPRFRIQTDLEYQAKIKENIEADEIIAMESNVCNFHYMGTKKKYGLTIKYQTAPKRDYTAIEDILEDYYWVRYGFDVSEDYGAICAYGQDGLFLNKEANNANIRTESIKEILPEGCVLYSDDLTKLSLAEDNTYCYLKTYYSYNSYYVGYPKDKYQEGDTVTNTVELWGRYEDEEEMQKLAEATSTVELVEFDFEYKGELYSIEKGDRLGGLRYVNHIKYNETGIQRGFGLYPVAFYTGSKMDVEIGDDLLYLTRSNGEVTKLEDDEYRITKVTIPVFYTYNKYTGKDGDPLIGYEWELQVRYDNTDEYVSYKTGISGEGETFSGSQSNEKLNDSIEFQDEEIAAVKVIIKDLDKTLYNRNLYSSVCVVTNIKTQNCGPGNLYNFCYMQVYHKDENGNRTLVNEPTLESYDTESTKLKIAEYDLATYGTYMQRAYKAYEIEEGEFAFKVGKSNSNLKNNGSKESYSCTYNIFTRLGIHCYEINNDVILNVYDILPKGIYLDTNEEEIIQSLEICNLNSYYKYFKLKGETRYLSLNELRAYIKEHTTVKIDYNYKNSGRTKIGIEFDLSGFDWSYYATNYINESIFYFRNDVKVEIPYDSILEYGTSYTNYIYGMWSDQDSVAPSLKYYTDKGSFDSLAEDIDQDGSIEDYLVYESNVLNISHAVSSQQAVIKQIRTDLTQGKYVEGTAEASAGEEYDYKLRITTGANSIKDLILYDNIETITDESGTDVSQGWKGSFLGVDTSYAESKGYAPKVYYSTELNPGKLTEVPDKWKLLDDSVDKSTVKSICVDLRYKTDGSEMELSPNNVVFVLIKMQAPDDETLTTSASNMFWTNWRAIDPLGGIIDNVEGIYSNQVNVEINKTNITTSISGQKIWVDEENKNNTRPASITVKLKQDGVEYTRKIVTESDKWSYIFENVPVYKDNVGTKYEYSIEEDYVEGYIASYEGNNIINEVKLTELKGEKIWIDEDNKNNTRPKSITVRLRQDGKIYAEKTITAEDNWSYTFENLPMYRNNEKDEYEYKVEEVPVVNYITSYEGNNIINEVNLTEFEVEKIWNDNGNAAGKRPEKIVVELKREGRVIRKITLNEETNWKYTFKALEKYNELGEEIVYSVDEQTFASDEWYVKEIVGGKITNKLVVPDERVKIVGSKNWDDNNNLAGKRPESVILQVKNGEEVVTEQVVTEEDNWSYEFELAKYDELGNEINYTIDEKEVGSKFYEKTGVEGNVVTNKFVVPDEKVEIWVDKKWEDEDNKYGKRPESVILQIKNGENVVEEVEVSEENNWRHKFELTKYDELGNEINYIVDEKETAEYYEKRIEGNTVINTCTYTPPTDTSDISVWVYIVVAIIAIVGIGVFVFVKTKQKKNLKK